MILLDTQVLAWFAGGVRRLSGAAETAFADPANMFAISAVTAFEFADLDRRGRFAAAMPLDGIIVRLGLAVLDFPAEAFRLIDLLPDLHRDPVDRMLVAHAIHDGLPIMTADAIMRRYPVVTIW